MRKKFIYFVLIPLVIVLVVVYLFIDRWVESALEYAGEEIVGAKVEIDNLTVHLSPLGIEFVRLQVASPSDPWKNIFETGPVRFRLDAGQLLRGKYIVETVEARDLILGTKRATDGSLPRERRTTVAQGPDFSALARDLLDGAVEKTPLFDIAQIRRGVNIDSLIRAQNFKSLAHIDTLKARVGDVSRQWEGVKSDIGRSEERLRQLEQSLRAINPSQLKTPDQVMSAITTVDNAKKTVDEITQTVSGRQASVRSDVTRITAAVDSIDDFIKSDYQHVLGLARLPDLKTAGIAEMLLGRTILKDVTEYLGYVSMARGAIKTYSPKPEMEAPPRRRGQDIHFPVERAYPKVWVKKILISGGTDRKQDPEYFYARGEVKDITSDQRVTGKPLTVMLEGTKAGAADVALSALFDRREETPLDDYTVRVSGLRLADVALGSSDFLPATITDARLAAQARVTVPGTRFDANVTMAFSNLKLVFGGAPRNTAERIGRDVLSGIAGFNAGLRLWNTDRAFDMAFTTNLDEQFARRLREVLGAELERLQAEIRTKVESQIAEKRRQFEAFYAEKRREADQLLGRYQTLVDQNLALVDSKKKELEAQLEKVKKGAVDDLMRNLLKK